MLYLSIEHTNDCMEMEDSMGGSGGGGADPGFWKGGGVVRGRSPSPARGGGAGKFAPSGDFEHLESLKWHFLHSEKAKCLILQFANHKM